MKKRTHTQAGLHRRPRLLVFAAAAALCAAMLLAAVAYMRLSSRSLRHSVIDLSEWQLCQADGAPLDGGLDAAGRTVCFSGVLPAGYDGQVAAVFEGGGASDLALLVDGSLAAGPSGRYVPGQGFAGPAPDGPADGVYTIDYSHGAVLTVALEFAAEPAPDALPTLTVYDGLLSYDSQSVALGVSAGLPAGVFLTVGGLLALMFLLLLWLGSPDWGMLPLAGAALAFCVSRTAMYADTTAAALRSPEIVLLGRNLPIITLIWLLLAQLTGRVRLALAPVALGCTGVQLALLVYNVLAPGRAEALCLPFQHYILPALLLALLAAGAAQAIRWRRSQSAVNHWYRRFFCLGSITVAALAAFTIPLWMFGNSLTGYTPYLRYAPQQADMPVPHSLFPWVMRLCYPVMIISCVLALYDFIRAVTAHAQQRQALELQTRFATEHAGALYRTLLETRSVRHEIRGRLETLRILCDEGDFDRVKAYVAQFAEQSRIAPGLYSGNMLVNALVAPRLQAAQDAGVKTGAMIFVPERLPMLDIDLSTLLVNALNNAVVAASAVPDPAARTLSLRLELRGNRLLFQCSNSYTGEIKLKPDGLPASGRGEWHGHGMGLMRSVAEKYGGFLNVSAEDGVFTVSAVMHLPGAPKA